MVLVKAKPLGSAKAPVRAKIGVGANFGCKETELTPVMRALASRHETHRTQGHQKPGAPSLPALWRPDAIDRQRTPSSRGQNRSSHLQLHSLRRIPRVAQPISATNGVRQSF